MSSRRKARPIFRKSRSDKEEVWWWGFHCVALLDILGQRRKLQQLPRLPKKDDVTTKLIAETVGNVLRLRTHLASVFEEFAKPTVYLRHLPRDAQKRILQARKLKFQGFSDLIAMQVSFAGDQEQCAPMIGVYGCIAACCMMHMVGLSTKSPIRGGIEVGLGMHIAENEVYGPVLERAYYLESELAEYPRILVGDQLTSYLDEVEANAPTTPLGRVAQSLASRSKQFIDVDTDGLRILDFLGEPMVKLTPPGQHQKLFPPAVEYIEEQKRVATETNDQKLLKRYERLGDYFEKRRALWSPHLIEPQESPR